MSIIFFTMFGLITGYSAGYFWKSMNKSDESYDMLVCVGYPILALIALGAGILTIN